MKTKDWVLGIGALVLSFLGVVSFCWGFWPAIIAIVFADLYLFAVLIGASLRAQNDAENNLGEKLKSWAERSKSLFPNRPISVLVLLCLTISLVSSFAGIFLSLAATGAKFHGTLESPTQAVHLSLTTMLTLGDGEFHAEDDAARRWILFELGSSILLFFTIFPLVISRISGWGQKER